MNKTVRKATIIGEDCMDIEMPDKIGFYWFKHFETQRWRTTEVFWGADKALCAYNTWETGFFGHDKIDSNSSIYSAVEEFEGEWYGPIEDPERGNNENNRKMVKRKECLRRRGGMV